MAISKHAFGRYQIIDRELHRKDWVKTRELKETIEEELSVNVSMRMINEDIIAMREEPLLGYEAPIEYDTRQKAYYYTDKTYTIKAFGLNDGDINSLMFYAGCLNQYKYYEVFDVFSNAIEKVLEAVKIRKGISTKEKARLVVQTENTPKLRGSEAIPILIQALDGCKMIEFEYKKYDDKESKTIRLHPHLLKEDRHRWYIVGRIDGKTHPTTVYALDRILSIKILDEKFTPAEFDFDQHYRYSFGITVAKGEPIEVVLAFTPEQGNYLKTLEIHHTQQTLVDNETEFRISVKVKPAYEFYEKILGYGERVKVISPDSVIAEMKNKIETLAGMYR
jgi:predicted DNA-binding transcriptional regulator YafY